jgi:hypothetical protein
MPCLHSPTPTEASSRSHERRRTDRLIATAMVTVLAGLALAVQAPVAGASSSFPSLTPDVAVVPFANDVYWFTNNALSVVDPASTPASAALFSEEGNPLHLTWGQFSSATARSVALTVTRRGIDYTVVGIVMSGLVPNGVYSLFYRTFGPDSNNSVCPNVEPTVALTAAFPQLQKPDPDSFVASSSGRAFFLASVAGRLLDAAQFQIAVIYHFDGNTYGPVPNQAESRGPQADNNGLCLSSYGIDAMRQLVIVQK